jgi:hypothetical protein
LCGTLFLSLSDKSEFVNAEYPGESRDDRKAVNSMSKNLCKVASREKTLAVRCANRGLEKCEPE